MSITFTRGSEWRKWDLQIQPIKNEWFCDVQNKKTALQNATREYLKKAIEKQVSVVAITDHNCGVAIDSALELVREESLEIAVLPGVEMDVNTGYQVLAIFNPRYKEKINKQTWEETVNHFLNNVCSLPSPVINAHGQAESIGGDIHEIMARICKEDICLPIFAHCQGEKGLFKKTTPANRKKFFENSLEGKYYFALDHKTDDDITKTIEIIKEWGFNRDDFVLIKTSDAHQASESGSSFTWIKSDPTYEGLKQIIYDPKSRIAVHETEPVKPNNVINSITITIPKDAKINVKQRDGSEKEESFCFAGVQSTFDLSPFFNCFIGGRGSGKSTILNFLGQHSKDPNSSQMFWAKILPSFDTKDQNIFAFDGVPMYEFIGQSEVESFATNTKAFTEAIYERSNTLSDDRLEKDEIELSALLNKLESFQSVIETLDKLVDEQASKEKEKKILNSAVKITESQEYSEIVEEITQRSNQKQQLEKWRIAIDELKDSINFLQKQHFTFDSKANDSEDTKEGFFDTESQEENVALQYKVAYEEAKTNIETAADILDKDKFKDLVEKEKSLFQEIDDHEKELFQLLKNAGLSNENILQAKSAPQKLVRIEDELLQIHKKVEDKKKELSEYEAILTEVKQVKMKYEQVIGDSIKPLANTLEQQAKENDKKDVKNIGLSYFFDEQQAWKEIAADFYVYFSEYHGSGDRPSFLQSYIEENKMVFSGGQTKINELLSQEEKKVGYLKLLSDVFSSNSNYQVFRTIRDKHLNDVARHKRIQVLYDGKDIENASFGQKCTAVMVILLLFGNYPLIIDEPEAHLDSSLIANYLVPLIKRTKNNRQIIFATHNANFVINGDSEKIFILENETGITEVIETTIENLGNRSELLKLEGGSEAFRKRGEKLHILNPQPVSSSTT